MLQLVIAANHQNGKDTHVRQVRVFGSRDGGGGGHALGDGTGEHFGGDAVADDIPMATVGMAMYAQLR